jgi:GNAT superfamily N-acetyltransferase
MRPRLALMQDYTPGAIARVAELHALEYHARAGFGLDFETGVARGLCEFADNARPGRDALWLLWQDGRIEGSIAIDGRAAPLKGEGAHLRWFIVSPALRGQGWGRQMLASALDFCDAQGWPQIYLWTFAGLDAARHLYDAQGFVCTHEATGSRWGRPVIEQRLVRQRIDSP